MTTLDLAERIAAAVLLAARPAGAEPYGDAPTQAVLTTLREHGAWFCRITEDVGGFTQLDLFETEVIRVAKDA